MSAETTNTPRTQDNPIERKAPLPNVIVFGGADNAISLVRAFGRRGIRVYSLNEKGSEVAHSRYVESINLPDTGNFKSAAVDYLLGDASKAVHGSVLIAGSDVAIEVIKDYRSTLEDRFLLDLSNPEAQARMLDKLQTYQVAHEHNVPTPLWWQARSLSGIQSIRGELVYPLIVKPRHSHLFQAKFDSKFIVAENFEQLSEAFRVTERNNIEVMLCEEIPGPDTQLCSYYTYLDEAGNALFNFTKRIIRRHPKNMGLACYHITDHIPELHDPALRLFRGAGLQGLANAEFKLDPRDGIYKLIECNARFTAANGLVSASGLDLGSLVYNRLAGLPLPDLSTFRSGLRLWDPLRDLKAFRELNMLGELSLLQWIRSVCYRQTFPAFSWADPMPSLKRLRKRFSKSIRL